MLQCVLDFHTFSYKTYSVVFMFEIFHPQSNAGLKASLTLMHMTIVILQSLNLEWQEKEFIICGGVYLQHRRNLSHAHTHIFVALVEIVSKNGH